MDLPEDFIKQGQIITQYAQLTNSNSETLVMECTIQVGNPYFTRVNEYYGTADPTETGVTFETQTFGTKNEYSSISTVDDPEFYELQDSSLDSFNKVVNCLADFSIEKDDTTIWDTYTVVMGARVFADREDTAPINLDTITFDITLEQPVIETIDFDDEDYNWDEELYVEKIWLPITTIESEVTYQA